MSEHLEQKAIMKWMSIQFISEYESTFAIPNGGSRHPAVGKKLKLEGVKAGVPDIFMALPRGQYHGLFIEYKTLNGRLQKTQREWLARLAESGYKAVCCNGIDAAMSEISNYLKM
jgi:hypothetical protein